MKRVMGIQLRGGTVAIALTLTVGVLMHREAALAAGLNYVDADDVFNVNLAPAAGGPLSDAVNTTAAQGDDNKWGFRSFGINGNIFESGVGNEDAMTGPPPETDGAPALVQTVSGLNPGSSYDLYTAFWSNPAENWTISTGVSLGSMTTYAYRAGFGASLTPGAAQSDSARGSAWDSPPALFTEGGRVLLLGKAGTATANGSGEVQVFIDDVVLGGSPTRRSWLDGVAWVQAGTPVSLEASVDRASGNFTLTNPTMQPFQIKKIDITSPSGSLNSTTWQSISGPNSSFDTDPWTVVAPLGPTTFTTLLSEQESASGGGSGGTLAASGGSLNLGNIWQRNPFEDLRIDLTLTDDSVVQIFPTFNGTPIASGDFNGDGLINTTDYQALLTNLHGSLTGLTGAESYARGDMVADAVIDYYDFAAFRAAYDAANGAGSFAQMVSQIPEPATAGLLVMAGMVCIRYARGLRRSMALAGLLCCVAASSSQAQTLLKVDVNDREMVQRDMTDVDNTVSGFGEFQLSGAVPGSGNAPAQGSTAATVNGYDVTVLAVNAAGNAQGGIDDRDRTTPITTPTLNQLYDDFIFTAGGVGVGGGIDLAIQGGALQPNTPYDFSMYSYDSGSTGARSADWLDGNRGDARSYSTKFNGDTTPTTDDQFRFTGVAVTDASGRLFLRGRNTTPLTSTGGIQPGVFVNGFEINPFTGLTLEINSTTGAVRLLNEQASPIQLSYYEIGSTSGALNLGGWMSLDEAEGSDPIGTGWDEAVESDANILSEGNLTSMLTLSASGGSASLGNAFSTGGAQDVFFSYAAPGATTLRGGFVKYVTGGGGGDADFNNDGDVDGQDLLAWQRTLGTAVANGTGADGSGNGVVDAADLNLWKSQFGNGAASPAAAAIPEPAALALAAFAGIALAASRRGVTCR